MRLMLHTQTPLVYEPGDHVQSRELAAISGLLVSEPELVRLVHEGLIAASAKPGTGRDAPSADQALRCLVIEMTYGLSYRDLEFHVPDAVSFRAFCRFGLADACPSKSALQRNIKCVPAACLEAINQVLVKNALAQRVESGSKVRVDCTVTETNIHEPTDSSLLWDCVRVLSRLANQAGEIFGTAFEDHSRIAVRRAIAIQNAKTAEQRLEPYKDLVMVTSGVRADALRVAGALGESKAKMNMFEQLAAEGLYAQIEHYAERTGERSATAPRSA